MEYAEVYLALTGVEGDARADEHKGEIELFDWAWGMEMADRSPTGKDEDRQAEGKMLEIAEYCCYDVKITKLVHEYGVAQRQLHYNNRFGKKLTVPVKWAI